MRIARRGIVVLVGVLGLLAASAGPAAAGGYTFTRVADSVADGLDPNNFGCATINDPGAIAFRAGRLPPCGAATLAMSGICNTASPAPVEYLAQYA